MSLHIILNGTLTVRSYTDVIPRPHLDFILKRLMIFSMYDNARSHTAGFVENMIQVETIKRME